MHYSKFKESEFYSFFNIKEEYSRDLDSGLTEKSLKTGGFQEYIDLYLFLDKTGEIKTAELILDRDWVGDTQTINPFGKDITKSFISLLFPTDYDPRFKKHLVHYLFNLRGNNQVYIPLHKAFQNFEESSPEVQPFLDVYKNIKQSKELTVKDIIINMENTTKDGEEVLSIIISWK
jgi:hypothetical protein